MTDHLIELLNKTGQTGFVWDIHSDKMQWIGQAQSILHTDTPPATGSDFKKMFNPQDLPEFMSEFQGRVYRLGEQTVQQSLASTIRLKGRDGKTRPYRLECTISLNDMKQPLLQGLLIDTALANRLHPDASVVDEQGRQAFVEHIDKARVLTVPDKNAGYVFILGFDRVRLLNMAYGANAVDALLNDVNARLNVYFSQHEQVHVIRLTGDNFGVLHSELKLTDLSGFVDSLQHIFRSEPFKTLKGAVTLGLTVGAAPLHAPEAMAAQDVLTQAETALYEAKNKGRGSFILSRPQSEKETEARNLLETSQIVLKAMVDKRIRLAFQPIINLTDNTPSFYECLVRMVDETGKIIPAAAFVPAMETLGLMRSVDVFVLRAACAELQAYPDIRLSVNVSATSLTDEAWVRAVVDCLADAPDIAKRLIIEITESAAMHDVEKVVKILSSIKAMGAAIALDDFGAGQTSFRQLKILGVSIVKIDREYVRNMHDPINRLFITALFDLARGLNIETVAEGAETMEDAGALGLQGIKHIQGFAYGQPSIHRLWLDDTSERAMLNIPSF